MSSSETTPGQSDNIGSDGVDKVSAALSTAADTATSAIKRIDFRRRCRRLDQGEPSEAMVTVGWPPYPRAIPGSSPRGFGFLARLCRVFGSGYRLPGRWLAPCGAYCMVANRLRQVFIDRLEHAAAGCRQAPLSDDQVHEVRKALKEARAVLRLLRKFLGRGAYRFENLKIRISADC